MSKGFTKPNLPKGNNCFSLVISIEITLLSIRIYQNKLLNTQNCFEVMSAFYTKKIELKNAFISAN